MKQLKIFHCQQFLFALSSDSVIRKALQGPLLSSEGWTQPSTNHPSPLSLEPYPHIPVAQTYGNTWFSMISISQGPWMCHLVPQRDKFLTWLLVIWVLYQLPLVAEVHYFKLVAWDHSNILSYYFLWLLHFLKWVSLGYKEGCLLNCAPFWSNSYGIHSLASSSVQQLGKFVSLWRLPSAASARIRWTFLTLHHSSLTLLPALYPSKDSRDAKCWAHPQTH